MEPSKDSNKNVWSSTKTSPDAPILSWAIRNAFRSKDNGKPSIIRLSNNDAIHKTVITFVSVTFDESLSVQLYSKCGSMEDKTIIFCEKHSVFSTRWNWAASLYEYPDAHPLPASDAPRYMTLV